MPLAHHIFSIATGTTFGLLAILMPLEKQTAVAQGQENINGAFQLWDGVIIDPKRERAFIMTPERTIDAIALSDGKVIWSTKAASKPLIVGSGRVVSQVESSGKGALDIVLLDAENGDVLSTTIAGLPGDVSAAVGETLVGHFFANGYISGDKAILVWNFRSQSTRGLVEPAQSRVLSGPVSGVVAVSLLTGKGTEAGLDAKSIAQLKNSSVAYSNRLDGKEPYVEGISADGRHRLVARKMQEQHNGGRFDWQISDVQTGKPVGQFTNNSAYSPFFVRGSIIYLQEKAHAVRSDDQLKTEPLRLRAVDMETERERWAHPVRDPSLRGPLPP